jgi:predicted GIY-YIG superfamily endonuclease
MSPSGIGLLQRVVPRLQPWRGGPQPFGFVLKRLPARVWHSGQVLPSLPAAGPKTSSLAWDKETAATHKTYWDEVLQSVDKPSAKRLLQFVDTSVPLGLVGYGSGSRSRGSARNGKGAALPPRPPSYSFFYETKLQHPDKVILCRVGEFYETIGIDAILMVQYAGLNPMGKEGNPPRAGCPRANLRRTVADLVENGGLSVVVCEEAPEPYNYGTMRRAPKERYVAAIVTPALPHFLHNMVDEEVNIPVEKTPPLLGISPAVGGYSVIELDAELMTVRETEGLTEDAVYSRLHEGGLVPPLYLHSPPVLAEADTRLRDSVPEVEWKQRIGSVFRTQGTSIVKYSDPDAVTGMVERVKLHLGLPADAEFRRLPSSSPKTRPRPLYFSTASNLGLHKTRGVPSLLDYALPAGTPLAARRWLRSLLLMPPEPSVAMALHESCVELWRDHSSLPNFIAMSPANVVLKLKKREGNADFFNELRDLCSVVGTACRSKTLAIMCDHLLVPVESETGVRLDRSELAEKLRKVSDMVDMVVVDSKPSHAPADLSPALNGIAEVMLKMKDANEDFRGKVKPEIIPHAVGQVETAWNRAVIEASACLALALQATDGASKEPYLSYDVSNNAVWIKIPRGTKLASEKASVLGLVHPRDRNGKIESAVYSTLALEESLDEYRRSCVYAHDAVRDELRELAVAISPNIPELVGAATFSLIACALEAHVRESKRRNWSIPTLVGFESSKATMRRSNSFKLRNSWPYWLGGPGALDPRVAKNSFEMNGMFLVTGPNMAGKSTMLRSTCACALLGACGLAVPASAASEIPYIDAFMLRNFSSDSPLEGRSSFAVEMMEMKYVLQDVTSRSLVLVDELGKGTEAKAGAALAGAMLEALDSAGCIGAFATHLHELLRMDLSLSERTEKMKMEVQDTPEGRHPTWKVVPGTSTESLALEVARKCNLPLATLKRAEELYFSGEEGAGKDPMGTARETPSVATTVPYAQQSNEESGSIHQSLESLSPLLKRTCDHVLDQLSSTTHASSIQVHHVPKGSLPGTQVIGRSCAYIARRPHDNRFYVGSSDQLRDRIITHRSGSQKQSQVHDPDAEFLYVVIPPEHQGSSAARAIEAAIIRECIVEKVPLLSHHDATSKTSPSNSRVVS